MAFQSHLISFDFPNDCSILATAYLNMGHHLMIFPLPTEFPLDIKGANSILVSKIAYTLTLLPNHNPSILPTVIHPSKRHPSTILTVVSLLFIVPYVLNTLLIVLFSFICILNSVILSVRDMVDFACVNHFFYINLHFITMSSHYLTFSFAIITLL